MNLRYSFFYTILLLLIAQVSFAQRPDRGGEGRGEGRRGGRGEWSDGERPNPERKLQGIGQVSGIIMDSLTNEPVEYATIVLLNKRDSLGKVTNGGLTDSEGKFMLDNLTPGRYEMRISFVGYQDKIIDTLRIIPRNATVNMGTIILAPSSEILKAVEIKGEAALVEFKIDKIVYNAEKDISAAGGNALELLRKVPLLSLDIDENVELRGSKNIQVLINGKPSGIFANSVTDALRMIASDQIKSVEVITMPSAKYDSEGTAGIVNIITKKKDAFGFNGSLSLSAGNRQNNASLNLNYRHGKFGMNLNGGLNLTPWRDGYTKEIRSSNSELIQRVFSQNGDNQTRRRGFNAGIGMDYEIVKNHTLTSNFRINSGGDERDVLVAAAFVFDSIGMNIQNYNYQRESANDNTRGGFDYSLDYKGVFKKPEQELTASFQYSLDNNNADYTLLQEAYLDTDSLYEASQNLGTNREIVAQIDYIHPFNNTFTLETGAKSTLRDIGTDADYQTRTFQNASIIKDTSSNNIFDYQQDVYATYAVLAAKFNNDWGIKAGTRWEYTDLQGAIKGSAERFENDYDNFTPSVAISKTFKQVNVLRLSYTKRLQRPRLRNLNPFRNSSDPRNVTIGNPNLNPELSDIYELSFATYIKQTVTLNTAVFFRRSTDIIESFTRLQGNLLITNFQNIGQSDSWGFNVFASGSLFPWWNLRGNLNLSTYQAQGTIDGQALTRNSFLYNFNINNTWNLSRGWKAELFWNYNAPRQTLQGTNPAWYMHSMGIKKDLFKRRGSIGFTAANIFTPYRKFITDIQGNGFTQYSENGVAFRNFGINFNWQFGKIEFRDKRRRGGAGGEGRQGDDEGF